MTHLDVNNPLLVPVSPERMRVLLLPPIDEDPLPAELLHRHERAVQVRVLAYQERSKVDAEKLRGEHERRGLCEPCFSVFPLYFLREGGRRKGDWSMVNAKEMDICAVGGLQYVMFLTASPMTC